MVNIQNQPSPLQAMTVNGTYLENVVSGYRTLTVEGREELNLDIDTISTNTRNGAKYKRRRIDSRVIIVNFALKDTTPEGFAEKFNTLKQYLYGIEEAQLIFDDEPDVYFTGSFRKVTASYAGHTSLGKIEILCADPFKYSLINRIATAVNGSATINYKGTFPSHPVLTAQSAGHDCGFYAFHDFAGHLVQVGNPAEQDQEEVPSDTATALIEQNFGSNYSPYTLWFAGLARLLYGYKTDNQGVTSATDYIYSLPGYPEEPNYYYGPALGAPVPASPNFELSLVNWFEPSGNQGGGFDIYVNNSGGGNICGVSIYRNKGGRVQWTMIVKGNIVKGGSYSLADNPFKGAWRTQTITKSLDTVTFNVGGVAYSVTDPELASHSYDAANISFVFYRQPGADTIGANNALKSITLRGFANTWQEVANKIPQDGLIEVDTGSGDISLNGALRPDLGNVSNDFEDFKLSTGINTVTFNASDWVDDAVYTLQWREVYL